MPELQRLPKEVYTDLVNHYRESGIEAAYVEREAPEMLDENRELRISGRNVDLVIPSLAGTYVERRGRTGTSARSEPGPAHPEVDFYHIVRGVPTTGKSEVDASLVTQTREGPSRELLDLAWEGGRLASQLNSDVDLRQRLLDHGVDNLRFESDPKNQCIRIVHRAPVSLQSRRSVEHGAKGAYEASDFPSAAVFSIVDELAGRIKRGELDVSARTERRTAVPA